MKKYLLGLAVAFALVSASSADAYTYTRSLTLGASGADVVALQTMLVAQGHLVMPAGVSMGYFGTLTQSAVAKWQAANGIAPAVGFFGPISIARASTMVGGSTGTTGGSTSTVPGCTAGALFSMTTGQPCSGSTGSTSSSSSLSGGAGDLLAPKKITSNTETTVAEGSEENVLGIELEADDNSDLAITSIRVRANVGSDGSTRLNRYVDEVVVYMGNKEVGSMDASDFSRTGANHTGTIALKDAVIKKGQKARFYVAFVAKEVIDTNDQDNTIDVSVDRIRFEDASGAVVTESSDDLVATVSFEDSTESDGAKVISSSATPNSSILKVKENSNSDVFHVFSFRIKGDTDSSDTVITKLPITLDVYNPATTTAIGNIVNELYVMVGNRKYDNYATPTTVATSGENTSVKYVIDIDEGDLEVEGGDTVEVKVYVKFGKQSGKYAASGLTVTAKVVAGEIVAENPQGDNLPVLGASSGKTHTVAISAADISDFKWEVQSTGAFIDFFFTVEADDEAFNVLSAEIASTTAGTATTSSGTLTKHTGDASSISGGFKVESGDTATFRVRYAVTGDNGTFAEVKVTSVAGQEVPTNRQVSPTAVRNVQQ